LLEVGLEDGRGVERELVLGEGLGDGLGLVVATGTPEGAGAGVERLLILSKVCWSKFGSIGSV